LTIRTNASFFSQIVSAFFTVHALNGGAHFSRRDIEAMALSNKDIQHKIR
jgi:hypothetical protein